MSDNQESDAEELWNTLDNYRARLTSVIEPSRITPYLRQCKVLNHEDEEQIFNDPNLVIRRRKVGMLLDILQRTGRKGYIAFLESLELYYPDLYRKITGEDPARTFSVILDAGGESSLTQLLMAEVQKQQQAVIQSNRRVQELTAELKSKEDNIRQMQVKLSELHKHQERFWKMREERNNYSEELRMCKEENYKWAKDFAMQSEEKNKAMMRNRDLQLEIEKLKHSLMLAEDGYKVERTHTIKLRHAMEQRPKQELIWELRRENDLLKAKLQELVCPVQADDVDKSKIYIQILEDDRRTALEEHQEFVNSIYSLRKELQDVAELRDKYLEEKEVFELKCVTLRKDSQMYKDRIEAILLQMQEVVTERDQALKSREEIHKLHTQTLQQKDDYRKLIREQGERCDELQIELFRQEEQLLNLQAKLKKVKQLPDSSITPTGIPDSEQDLAECCWTQSTENLKDTSTEQFPETLKYSGVKSLLSTKDQLKVKSSRLRMKKSFEDYRRKRAIRLNKQVNDGAKENMTASETTDSDYSEGEGGGKSDEGR
ncbi:caspase recruitment domain-containing protein 9 [Hypanus sabinus]|uniref:caspase recruitment domain-containing protein 9 n=1 Tax=Hypanus sabinus TaxID=79690 RepID=UPI0028C47FF4|nr:caspase recruitment domain-containing protein 9 [Hypanus sabinus]XP_059799768.1 caspase recruitment domain-containing protein 9 [Hypanus sabinus]XP_059799769.1 caspase recruitment domain-containing protein 9 [Hypanus sabinus]XP_059799770.1 caspase recruitment domain-containing protein 9 [Hypanus sabinus]XP_059799771.1 caspase recruitment domain-containing protein 9 [Hypanus sabinus]